jgi:hypothetical protein
MGQLNISEETWDALPEEVKQRLANHTDVWGVLNAVRVAIKFSTNKPPGKTMEGLREMLPRIDQVLQREKGAS